jgi:hypothetical protein
VITTPDLIESLSSEVAPVKRLRPPLLRASCWILLALFVLVLLAISQGIRSDLMQRLQEPEFVLAMAASMATGVLGAVAAFLLSLPDRSRWWAFLPLPTLCLWLSSVGYQCLTNWVVLRPGTIMLGEAVQCFATLVLTSLPLSLAMLVMLRYAAPLRPVAATLTGSLAVSALAASALSLFHELDASVMILVWNVGTAALIVGLAGALRRRMFSWVAPKALPRET